MESIKLGLQRLRLLQREENQTYSSKDSSIQRETKTPAPKTVIMVWSKLPLHKILIIEAILEKN